MGASKSKPTAPSSLIGTPSSAAFGRLRFDSPGKSPLLQRRLAQRRHHNHHHHHEYDGAAASPYVTKVSNRISSSTRLTTTTTNEQSSLLNKSSKTQSQPPQMDDENKRRILLQHEESSSLSITAAASPPALLVWIGPALTCALCYALYNIFIKKGSSHISPILGGVILQFIAALFGSMLLLYLLLTTTANSNNSKEAAALLSSSLSGDNTASSDPYYYTEFSNQTTSAGDGATDASDATAALLAWNSQGLMWAVLAGVAVGAAEMISFFVSSLGVQAMQSIPIIVGGSVLMGTVLGWLWLGEQLTVIGWSGVCLISIGIGLVGLDAPAGEGHH